MSTLAVYDCMLFFRAVSRPSRVRPIFDLVADAKVTLCFSPEVLAEIRDVLTRPKLLAKYPALRRDGVDAFLVQHLRAAKWVTDVPEEYLLARDPKDSKYVNLAIAAGAPYLVTTDRDLLALMESTSSAGHDFQVRYPGIYILEPAVFQTVIEKSAEENG